MTHTRAEILTERIAACECALLEHNSPAADDACRCAIERLEAEKARLPEQREGA